MNPARARNKNAAPPKPYRKAEPGGKLRRRPSAGRLPSRGNSRPNSKANSRANSRGSQRGERSNSRGSRRGSIDKIRIYGVRDQASKEN